MKPEGEDYAAELSRLPLDEFVDIVQEVAKAKGVNLKHILSDRDPGTAVGQGESRQVVCPDCGSSDVRKNGKRDKKQRYLCKQCGYRFTGRTGTLLEGSSHSWGFWRETTYALLNDIPLREFEQSVNLRKDETGGIDYKTCWTMRMKLKHALAALPAPVLTGIVEMKVLYFRESQKGSRNLVSTMPAEFGSRTARSGHSVSEYGYLGAEFVSVIVAMDSNRHCACEVIGLGSPDAADIATFFRHHCIGVDCVCTSRSSAFIEAFSKLEIPHFVDTTPYLHWSSIESPVQLSSAIETIESISAQGKGNQSELLNLDFERRVSFAHRGIASKLTTAHVEELCKIIQAGVMEKHRGVSTKYLKEEIGYRAFLQNWREDNGRYPLRRDDASLILETALRANTTFGTSDIRQRRNSPLADKAPSDDYLRKLSEETEYVRTVTSNRHFKFQEQDELPDLELRQLLQNSSLTSLRRFAFICFKIADAGEIPKDSLIEKLMGEPRTKELAWLYLLDSSVNRADPERKRTLTTVDKAEKEADSAQLDIAQLKGRIIFLEASTEDIMQADMPMVDIAVTERDGTVLYYRSFADSAYAESEGMRSSYEEDLHAAVQTVEKIISDADVVCCFHTPYVCAVLASNGVRLPRKKGKFFSVDTVFNKMYNAIYGENPAFAFTPSNSLEAANTSRDLFLSVSRLARGDSPV